MKWFLLRIQEKRVSRYVKDGALWIELKSEKFSVKSLYVALEPGSLVPFSMSIIWSSCVSPKVVFFAWEHRGNGLNIGSG